MLPDHNHAAGGLIMSGEGAARGAASDSSAYGDEEGYSGIGGELVGRQEETNFSEGQV